MAFSTFQNSNQKFHWSGWLSYSFWIQMSSAHFYLFQDSKSDLVESWSTKSCAPFTIEHFQYWKWTFISNTGNPNWKWTWARPSRHLQYSTFPIIIENGLRRWICRNLRLLSMVAVFRKTVFWGKHDSRSIRGGIAPCSMKNPKPQT